jgi:hypothetical protein
VQAKKIPGYVAARPFHPVTPARAGDPEGLTRGKADAIREHVGERLDLVVHTTPFSSSLTAVASRRYCTETSLLLVEAEWSGRRLPKVPGMDGALWCRFRVHDREWLQRLIDHRDPDWGPEYAFQHRLLHWGTQNWGGLTWSLSCEGTPLYCCDVDAFLPEEPDDLTEDLYLHILSFTPQPASAASEPEPAPAPAPEPEPEPEPESQPQLVGTETRSGRAPATDSDGAEGRDPSIGRCVTCGTRLSIDAFSLSVAESRGGIALVPCGGCGDRHMVRIANETERRRGQARFQVVQSPTSSGGAL